MVDYKESHEYIGMKRSMEAFSKEVGRLPKEMEHYGRVCVATADRTNALAVEAYNGVTGFDSLMSLLDEADNDVYAKNNAELEREGFTREDWENGEIPAYLEERLYAEDEPDRYGGFAWDAFMDLYETAYKADFVLTDETKALFGPDYAGFVQDQMTREAEEKERSVGSSSENTDKAPEARRLPDTGNVICDPETGIMHSSLTDAYGNPVDDDFAFDEPV